VKDEEIIEVLRNNNDEFRRLYQEHRALDEQLGELSRKHYLTPDEEIELKRLKKEKLYRKDKIAELVREYRKQASVN
jgi:uncharacterized protein YdcH (DUF465 family)